MLQRFAETAPMSTLDFRFPGVLNSKEMLIAEAIQARAWEAISIDLHLVGAQADEAKARLGGIIVRLMMNGPKSLGDLAAEAVQAFNEHSGEL